MKRLVFIAIALTCAACLSVDKSPIAAVDVTAPTLLRMKPNLLEPPDAGVVIPVAGSIELTFSEEMDPDSLRAGIGVRNKGLELPLNVLAPPVSKNPTDLDREYTVTVSAAGSQGFEVGYNRLLLRTLLIDQQGNAIVLDGEQQEVIYFFLVR